VYLTISGIVGNFCLTELITNFIISSMDDKQEIIDLLHDFHSFFGHSEPKIPPSFDVGKLSSISIKFSQAELDIMRTALADLNLRQAFAECQMIIEDLATRLTTQELCQT
jgi:hypothetical protein